jgi:RNA polymerase sigma-70 factor (ECF subfamily)
VFLTTSDLKAALLEIGAPFREVFELHEFARLSYEEIAGRLDISPNTVGTRLHRARRKLREVLMKFVSHDPEDGA